MNAKHNWRTSPPRLLTPGRPVKNSGKFANGSKKQSKQPCGEEDRDSAFEKVPKLLPDFDARTGRMETGAFFMLEFIGIALIVLAAGNAIRFSENRDAIAESLSSGGVVVTARDNLHDTNHVVTNLSAVPVFEHGKSADPSPSRSHQS